MNPVDPGRIKFGGPAKYQIVVLGIVDPKWGDRLGGMSITCPRHDPDNAQTVLSGWIHDQAELKGILDTLYGLHCTILRVNTIPDAD